METRKFHWHPRFISTVFLALLCGCHVDHRQSILHPESPSAHEIAWLWWFLFSICTIVLLVVSGLTIVAIVQPRKPEPTERWNNRFILILGAALPSIILVVILFLSVIAQKSLQPPQADITIRVTGHRWWWEVEYVDENIRTANEICIPVGRPVRLELHSADVIHSFWVPNLQGKADMIPGQTNATWLSADRAGVFRGQCAEYCGVQHAKMGLRVIAVSPAEFAEWRKERQDTSRSLVTPSEKRGREVFLKAKCNNCHAIDSENAESMRGPDLTHVGSRTTIAAGVLDNNQQNLSAWIEDPQAIKPGSLMPHTALDQDELDALVHYLLSLR